LRKAEFFIFIIVCLFFIAPNSLAREYVSDWYIKDFQSEIIVNKDSSLTITEKIVADCGDLPDKHGIFRIIPTQIKTTEGTIQNPIELIGITDFNDNSVKYTTIKSAKNHTITWKIGDPNITVQGENYYKIKYRVKNAVRFGNSDFDELYWNLNGNFWDIETDYFLARIFFPDEVKKENSQVDYYTGYLGEKGKGLAQYRWVDENVLEFYSTKTLAKQQGITVSVTFPKNIFTPYEPSFYEQYGIYFWYLIPFLVFVICFMVWKKYGDDPSIKKTIIPEFEIPENFTPMQMGMLVSNGMFNTKFISATIIDLAVRGFISIEETKDKVILFSKKDFRLKRLHPQNALLSIIENSLLDMIFGGGDTIYLSDLKKTFYKHIPEIRKSAKNELIEKELITKKGLIFQILFMIIGFLLLSAGVPAIYFVGFSIIISGAIIVIFSFIMPKRTLKGAELNWRVKGFKLYMKTAEQYRQQFFEKENIFEKLLPYAMIFNMTKEWVKKMRDIYGEDYFKTHVPAWYVGTIAAGGFDIDSFASHVDSLSSSISSNVGGPSGAGGAGGAGGGGGGGGGGGW
jgi:uncharacterized membrane protein